MDFKLAIAILTIGVISLILLISYGIIEAKKINEYKRMLKANILTNIGLDINNSMLQEESIFNVAKKANNAGPNHCDIDFQVDFEKLTELEISPDFTLTSAKEG